MRVDEVGRQGGEEREEDGRERGRRETGTVEFSSVQSR